MPSSLPLRYWGENSDARRGAPRVSFRVADNCLHFGEVWEDTAFSWVLQVHNSGVQDIHIPEFGHSCSCTKIDPQSLVIPAGGSRDLKLTIDLTEKNSGPHALSRPFRVQLWPKVDLPERARYDWTITGTVRTPLRFGQSWLDLGSVHEGEQPLYARPVTVTALVPLRRLIVSCSSPWFHVRAMQQPNDQSTFSLQVTALQALPPGPIKFDVSVVPELRSGKRLAAKRLPVAGSILSDLQASPPEGVFGALPVGETVEETITLHSLRGEKFEVTGVKVAGEGLTVRALRVATGEPTYQLRQEIAREGEQVGSVVLVVRKTDGVVGEVRVGVSYRGLPVAVAR